MSHFDHGALDKVTKIFMEPNEAAKRTRYECPDCKRDVFVRKGSVRQHHFAHIKDTEHRCMFYNRNPTLDQQHKNAQFKLKDLLQRRIPLRIVRSCICCSCCSESWNITIPENPEVVTEHQFLFNGGNRRADVSLFGEIKTIFEIVHKHHTKEEDRPEPWYEISAEEINHLNLNSPFIILTCVRQKMVKTCIEKNKRDAEARRHLHETERERLRKDEEIAEKERGRLFKEIEDRLKEERRIRNELKQIRLVEEERRRVQESIERIARLRAREEEIMSRPPVNPFPILMRSGGDNPMMRYGSRRYKR